MLSQKQKLPLIQVPGTDMVDTTATHTDTEATTAVDTTGVRFCNYLIHLQYHRKISNTALLTTLNSILKHTRAMFCFNSSNCDIKSRIFLCLSHLSSSTKIFCAIL